MKRYNTCDTQNEMVQLQRPEKKQKCICNYMNVCSTPSNVDSNDIGSLMKFRTSAIDGKSLGFIPYVYQVDDSATSFPDGKNLMVNDVNSIRIISDRTHQFQNEEFEIIIVQFDKRSIQAGNLQKSEYFIDTKSVIQNKRHTKTVKEKTYGKIEQARRMTNNNNEIAEKRVAAWKLFIYHFQDQMYHSNTENLMKAAVFNLFPELMLGIQYQRNNTVCIARIVFKTGVQLYQFGYIDNAMYLYDALLGRLLCISGVGNSKNDSTDLLEQEELYDRQRTSNMVMAKSLYKESLNAFLLVFPRMMATLKKLGTFHLSINDVDMALDCFNNVNQVDEIFMKTCCCNMIEALMNIALIHRRRSDWAMALTKYIQVYFLKCRIFGPRSLEVATSLSLIALMQYRLRQYSSAYEMYYESLSIQVEILGGVNLCVASTLNSLGLCCFYLKFFRRAKSFFLRCLKIRQNLTGSDNYDLAIIWYNIGTVCVENGDETEAIKCYVESLRIEEINLDYNKSEGAILAMKNLGYIYQRNGEIDEAAQYFRRALEIQQKKTSPNPDSIGKAYNVLGNIHLQKGNVAEMMDCYTNAARCYKRTNETMLISGYTFYCLSKLHPQCSQAA
jgi:tetratricopeptide (TPR) repeat protein